ncbi:MAG: CoA-transferase [Acidimicrobiales bacterium]
MSTREEIASAIAGHLEDDSLINVGVGIPGLVPHFVANDRGIVFHAEHGVVGFGSDELGPESQSQGQSQSHSQLAFFGTSYGLHPGGFVTDHTRSFAIVRSGRLDCSVLGAFQVDISGTFAGFQTSTMRSGCPGGSPEIGGAAKKVIIATEHRDPDGRPKLVRSVDLPVGVNRPAALVVTELGSFVPTGDGFAIERLAEGVSFEEVAAATDAEVFS